MTLQFSTKCRISLLACLSLMLAFHLVNGQIDFQSERETHQPKRLSVSKQKSIAKLSNHSSFRRNILQEFLIERVADTEGNRRVQRHIRNWMQTKLGWFIEEDSFNDSTPLGVKKFTNIIATSNPSARRRLVFACHFDSKLFDQFTFIGATDSAVPCAMLIDLARSLNSKLNNTDSSGAAVSLQLVFFDGEEAFRRWTATDSLYGSRHLAGKWSSTSHPQDPSSNILDGMDMLVLLDLIGARNPRFVNFFPQKTGRHFQSLMDIESSLHQARMLRRHRPNQYFVNGNRQSTIQDDHIPFMQRGVPIIHAISVPFPSVWHTVNDNAAAIHHSTVNNLNRIFRVFIAEYLRLRV